jgi:hypothetical protein
MRLVQIHYQYTEAKYGSTIISWLPDEPLAPSTLGTSSRFIRGRRVLEASVILCLKLWNYGCERCYELRSIADHFFVRTRVSQRIPSSTF